MRKFNLDKMLYTLTPEEHDVETIKAALKGHPEVKFVSLTGVDMGNHSTDEKIPVKAFLADIKTILAEGAQTDGSSVSLPTIADLSNARVDILPDKNVNWYVEYNFNNVDFATGLPTGTLRIPSFLRHNGDTYVGSRTFLKETTETFKKELWRLLEENPYVFEHMSGVDSIDEIEEIVLTNATELEFWVKTPDDKADRDSLFTSQELKEQYWKRTIGPVQTALEQAIDVLDRYGFDIEMGHKEVGGVRAKMDKEGSYNHIMEQLEIDWKYSNPIQCGDNESQIKNIVRDVFRYNNLEVTFLAKPVEGVAGNGEHTHFGVAALLKNGKRVNLFETNDRENQFMNPIGYGALMGILKNYELFNPFVAATHDAFQRLKPGYEAPVCVVTSLGQDYLTPSRNRTILIGLVRDLSNPMATRFELRSPNPHTNTYLVCGVGYMLMLDGIKAVLEAGKTSTELEAALSKKYGEEVFYLEKDREYRSEKNIFTDYTEEERAKLFGEAPSTVWQCFQVFDDRADELEKITLGDEVLAAIVKSYRATMIAKWSTEYHDRLIPQSMDFVRRCVKAHGEDATDYDMVNWESVNKLRLELGKDSLSQRSVLSRAKDALDEGAYEKAAQLELEIQKMMEQLRDKYNEYRKNLF
ncbi:MAG: glutamine synthetase [Firmicutes bacterium]|nr:glutamine synthetase [Bacillota bacterium]